MKPEISIFEERPTSPAMERASSNSTVSRSTGCQNLKLEPLRAWTASARLSSTLKRLKMLVIW